MIRLSGIVIALVAGFAVACGSGTSSKDKTATAVAAPKSVTVQVDGTATDHNEAFLAYFPDAVTVHAGDTVKFTLHDSGEPHTVSFGTFADPLFSFLTANCPNGIHAAPCDNPPPDLNDKFNQIFSTFPSVFPQGPGDVNQGPTNPCFMDTGDLPVDKPCPKADQPELTGKQSVYSSGWLPADKDFSVKLADSLPSGAYKWICLVHGPEMTGTLTVVDKATPAQSAAEVKSAGDDQLAKAVAAMKPAADELATKGTATNPLAGGSSQTVAGFIAEFAPATSSIPVGGSITWTVDGGHTISFNPPEDAKTLRKVAADGTMHANEKATTAAGVPEPPPPPDDPNAPPPLFDAGTWDGSGFLSSGLLEGGEFKLTFSKAGTYTYKCLIHDKMEGTVKVGT